MMHLFYTMGAPVFLSVMFLSQALIGTHEVIASPSVSGEVPFVYRTTEENISLENTRQTQKATDEENGSISFYQPIREENAGSETPESYENDSANPGDLNGECVVPIKQGVAEKDAQAQIASFRSWFKNKGGTLHRNVRIKASVQPDGTRSIRLINKSRVSPFQAVVKVPRRLLLWAPREMDLEFPELTHNERLAIYLLEKFSEQNSLWEGYFSFLPGAPMDTALYLDEDDLTELRNTYTITLVNKARQVFQNFVLKVRKQPKLRRWCTDDLKWALSIVESRSFTVSKPSNTSHELHERPFLAPLADFLNHNPSAEVGWSVGRNAEDDVFQVTSVSSYNRAGEEVFNHYQDFGNEKLFTYFGFTVPVNPHDEIRLVINDQDNPPPVDTIPLNRKRARALAEMAHKAKGFKEQLLQELSLSHVQHLCAKGIHVSLLNVARIISLTLEDFSEEGLQRLRLLNDLEPISSQVYGIENSIRYHESLTEQLHSENEAHDESFLESAEIGADAKQTNFLKEAHLGSTKHAMDTLDALPHSFIQSLPDASEKHIVMPLRVELKAYKLVRNALLSLLSRYPTTLSEDENILAELGKATNRQSKRERLQKIVQCRLGEKRILVKNIQEFERALEREHFEDHVIDH